MTAPVSHPPATAPGDWEGASPAYHTPRDPDTPTLGHAVAELMTLDGRPPMPWQRHLLDVALEREPYPDPFTGELAWRYRYRSVVVTVPRQQGKTTLSRGLLAHRLLAWPSQTVLGIAQDRLMATETWENVCQLFARPPLDRLRDGPPTKGSGKERLRLVNGSRYLIAAPTEKAGHGLSLDLPFVDEAWSFADHRLAQSLGPAMIARPDPQLWVVSTAGTAESAYLRDWVDQGRAGAPGVAYVEYSAPPDADPADPATWRACNPAWGYTITDEALAAAFQSMPLAEFERAHLNRWTAQLEHALPPAWWAAAADPAAQVPPVRGQVDVALDVNVDRSSAAIALSGRDGARVVVELVDHRGGTDWVADRAHQLWRDWAPPWGITLDAIGPAATVADELERRRVPVTKVNAQQVASACGGLFDDLRDDRFRHRAQPALDAAADGAVRRVLADRFAFARKKSSADISPLMAATFARYATVARPDKPTSLVRTLDS